MHLVTYQRLQRRGIIMSYILKSEKILKDSPGTFNRHHYLVERPAGEYPAGSGTIKLSHCFCVITLTKRGERYAFGHKTYQEALKHFEAITTPIVEKVQS